MNKREKAIWNIVTGISVIVLFLFTYSLWTTNSSLNSKKKGFNKTLKKFKDYDIPSSPLLISVLKNNEISISNNKKNDSKENTISNQKEFIEYKKVVSKKKDLDSFEKKKPFTSIVGFSVNGNGAWDEGESFEDSNNNGIWDEGEFFIDREEKIKPGCYLLTEINGKKFSKSSCSNKDLIINNISFFNDRVELMGFENLNAYGSIVNGEKFTDTGNGKWDKDEPFTDIGNGQYDTNEEFTDTGNRKWDEGEDFQDEGNGRWDEGEDFTDLNNNQKWDDAEHFIDLNNNNIYDVQENYDDKNNNGTWDEGEGFKDLNGNQKWDDAEKFTDSNNNGKWDDAEKFIDRPDGVWNGEAFTDLGNQKWDDAEKFTDSNDNGKWDDTEKFIDSNDNGKWDDAEKFIDIGNGEWDEGESYIDLGNGQYDLGEDFTDLNDNGKWDFVLLNNLKATKEEALEVLSSNYFYSELTDGNKKINIYIKTNEELDEYQIHADCFECAISNLEESMNGLEISLNSQREHEFELPETVTDPTDLSNVIILPGFEGGYNQSARRNTPRLSLITYKDEGANSKVSIDYKGKNYILKEKEALEDNFIIHKIYPDYIEYKKDNEFKILKPETK
tara:strand:+ start:103 stop:1944 length:1842 start_codon:yes stop_codon:yes gene_type:complete